MLITKKWMFSADWDIWAEHEDEIWLWLDKVRVLFLPIMVYVVIIQSKFWRIGAHLKI